MILSHQGVVGVPGHRTFVKRWKPLFGKTSWWNTIEEQYDRVRDYDDGGEASTQVEQMLYERAKAANLDVTQICPRCRKTVDQPASIDDHDDCWCTTCLLAEEQENVERDAIESRRQEMAGLLHEAWLQVLPPEERAEYQRQQMMRIHYMFGGLIHRSVQ